MNSYETFSVILATVQVLATVLIAVVLYRQARSLKRAELHAQAIQAYNHLNAIAVSNAENLIAFDTLGRPNTNEDELSRRRRWCAFIWLEALQITFTGVKNKMINEAYAERAMRQQLETILKDV